MRCLRRPVQIHPSTSTSEVVDSWKKTLQSTLVKIDQFGYNQPVASRRGTRTGCLTFVMWGIWIAYFVHIIGDLVTQDVKINRKIMPMESGREWPNVVAELPELFIQPTKTLAEAPFANNPSYYEIEVYERIIKMSRNCLTPPCETMRKLDLISCPLKPSEKHKPLSGYCLDKQYWPKFLGAYEDELYRYLTINVMPCHLIPENTVKCASQQDIEDLFWKNHSTMALWIKENQQRSEKWHSRVYFSVTPEQWIGAETFRSPKRYLGYDLWGGLRMNQTSAAYDDVLIRRGPVDDKGYLTYYLRMSSHGTMETGTTFTILNFLSKLGGFAGLVWSVFHFFGRWYNKWRVKKLLKRREEETREETSTTNIQRQISDAHYLSGLQEAKRLLENAAAERSQSTDEILHSVTPVININADQRLDRRQLVCE